ncbi:MAG: KH domain-containing protein [Anaerolineae bacterium]
MTDPTVLVRYIAEHLVEKPEAVEVGEGEGRRSRVVHLAVAPDDMGRVIGRDGRVANAVRTLLAAGRFGERWGLEVRDDDD